MMSMLLTLTFCLSLLSAVLGGLSPQLPAKASTPLSASSASSSYTVRPSSPTTSAPAPELTPPPEADEVTWGLQEKWHITTFWTCITIATQTHCGWQEPIEPGSDEIGGARTLNRKKMAGLAGAGALVVAGLLL